MKKLLLLLLVLSAFASYSQVPSYVPTNGLVGYWPFNGNANDVSGNGNNGTVNGATLTTDRFGTPNNSYYFNGQNGTSIKTNYNGVLNGQSRSISFWSKRTEQIFNGSFILTWGKPTTNSYNTTGGNCYAVFVGKENGLPFIGVDNGGSTSGKISSTVIDSTWHNYTIVFDSTMGQLVTNCKIYIDGNYFSNNVSYAPKNINTIGEIPLTFGEYWSQGGDFRTYLGSLDDIAIYNRALTQQEITQLYTGQVIPSYVPTNGLVGYWPFNGNANDVSGNGNNGTVNGATLTTDRFGNLEKAYSFDGVSNGVVVAHSPSLIFTNQLSFSVWLYSDTSKIADVLEKFTASNGQNGDGGPQLTLRPNNTMDLAIWKNNISNFTYSSTIYNKQWYNIIATWNGTQIILYQNGVPVDTFNFSQTLNPCTFPLYFGFRGGNNDNYFKGKLDDIAIWNRALSQSEITSLYTSNSCIANITNNDTTICRGASVTLNAAAVNSSSVIDINGNVYPTVNIGSQTWMQKNLNVSKYKNGDVIPQVTNATQWANLTTGAWCWYNNDSATYAATYGKLYNWYAVNDTRGLAPEGWHVSTESEWNKLLKNLDALADTACQNCLQSSYASGPMKEIGTIHWASPNAGATNASGLTVLPAGNRDNNSVFNVIGLFTYFWSKEESSADNSWLRKLNSVNTNVDLYNVKKTHGFSVRCLKDILSNPLSVTPTYLWSTGATTPSITVSPLVTTTYYCTVSDGVNTCTDSVKITVGATAIPSAPATLTGATDVCSYFSSTTSATSNAVTYTAATVSTASSYTWTVPAGVTLVSGQGTNSITVTFASTFVSGAISVKSVNACGSSTSAKSLTVYKRVAATPGTIQKEFSPTSIVAVTNVTSLVSETYRIKKVTYATSYNWSMNQGTNATITHINPLGVNDTAVIVTFASCFIRDTLSVKAVTPCSVSTARTSILYAYSTPASVLGITTIGGNFATCIGVNKTFTAIRGTPTTTQAPISSFRWTRPANTSIVSATSDSASITVSFNTGYTGGSISAKGVSQCGTIGTTASTAILQFLPPGVLSIASSTGSYNACIGNSITYSALVSAPTTSQVAASVFRWTKPNNTSITSASADSSTITLQFNTGFIGGTLSVKGQTSCGTQGNAKNQTLTHAGCAVGTKMGMPITTTEANSFEVSLYPNPSAGEFNLLVNLVGGKTPTMATVKVIDLQGRLIKSFQCNANQVTALGNELKPGVYMVEVRMGNEVKTVRAVRF